MRNLSTFAVVTVKVSSAGNPISVFASSVCFMPSDMYKSVPSNCKFVSPFNVDALLEVTTLHEEPLVIGIPPLNDVAVIVPSTCSLY